jgi:hypothetical protein
MKTFNRYSICLVYLIFSLVAVSAPAATELARINDKVITLEDFNKKYQENLMFFQ